MSDTKLTPMQRQYEEVRRTLPPGTLLLFRLGDFYEMFHEDAEEGARLLGITLTARNGMPMAGIPVHAADAYLGKLLAAGRRVAICDQIEPPRPGKLVQRRITRIFTPGTRIDATQLDPSRASYLAAVSVDARGCHAAWLDLSTGDFALASSPDVEQVAAVLHAIDPAEVLLVEGEGARWAAVPPGDPRHVLARLFEGRTVTERAAFQFEVGAGEALVREALGVLNLAGFGIAAGHSALGPAGAVLAYARDSLRALPANLAGLREVRFGEALLVDPATLRNLEILRSSRGARDDSLLDAVDATLTPSGGRLLEAWLAGPVLDLAEIRRRQDAVDALLAEPAALADLREALRDVRDLVRALGRLQNRQRNPRDLGAIRATLETLPAVREAAARCGAGLGGITARLSTLPELASLLRRALKDELPNDTAQGGYIRPGFDAECDRLHSLAGGHRQWLADFERAEQERTGIRSLKVRYNAVTGYFIEITKANLHRVPADYRRKGSMAGAERFVTEELVARQNAIETAEDDVIRQEAHVLEQLVAAVLAETAALRVTAEALAELDVLAGWALLAREGDWARPVVEDSTVLEIEQGRHPVVERVLRRQRREGRTAEPFVPNDTFLDAADAQICIVTGPNMGGKSTFIRQVALLTLLAHVGCPVPARRARIGMVDRIFSRIGASDDLARGSSTFLVEMNETANILRQATPRSLVVLDEIGRGTSTYDGLSIAWAVVEYLHGTGPAGPRTLFATHYQELTQLEKALPRVRNASVLVKEWNDRIVFVRRVVPGPADRSYGIQVARLAGLPDTVIRRAGDILRQLETGDASVRVPPGPRAAPRRKIVVEANDGQLDLFGAV